MNEVQKQELEIIVLFDALCKKHDLKYFLAYGTLLGAVRHEGFIPWDDDIDVGMIRSEYERFEKLYVESEHIEEGFILQSRTVFKHKAEEIARIRNTNISVRENQPKTQKGNKGPWIDIIPFDNLADDPDERESQLSKILFYNNWLRVFLLTDANEKDRGIKRFIKKTVKVFNELFYRVNIFIPVLQKKRFKIMTKYNSVDTKGKADLAFIWYKDTLEFENSYRTQEYFDCYSNIEFEGKTFPILKNPRNYLESLYEDYLKLPPEEEQKTHSLEKL